MEASKKILKPMIVDEVKGCGTDSSDREMLTNPAQ
jgi:hypothetical protein